MALVHHQSDWGSPVQLCLGNEGKKEEVNIQRIEIAINFSTRYWTISYFNFLHFSMYLQT